MSKLIFVHRLDNNNAGDLFSCPNKYFDFRPQDQKTFDIKFPDTITEPHEICIVGGGGLGKPWFYDRITVLFSKNIKSIVTWGIGYNHFEINQPITKLYKNGEVFDVFEKAELKSSRDFNYLFEHEWVPCVSCMSSLLDKFMNIRPKKKVGVIYHGATKLKIDGVNGEDYLTNFGPSMEEKLNFISNYEFIISNSYHGIYWSTLLNKKVLSIPWKSSIKYMKHQPREMNNKLSLSDNLKTAINFSKSLNECRDANINYYNKIRKIYGI